MEGAKDFVKGAEANFKELQAAFEGLTGKSPFNIPRDIKTPLSVQSQIPEIHALEYVHEAKAGGQSKNLTVTSPFKFILCYSGYSPKRLKELLASRGNPSDLQEFLLHTIMLNVVLSRQPSLARVFDALRFPVTSGKIPGCGDLNFTFLTAAVPTQLPPDDVVIENTEISGSDTFEEVINLDELSKLRDPFKDKLLELAKQHGELIVS